MTDQTSAGAVVVPTTALQQQQQWLMGTSMGHNKVSNNSNASLGSPSVDKYLSRRCFSA